MPADPKCTICNGSGHIIIDSLHAKRCDCLTKSLYAKKLGMFFQRVSIAKDSPYLEKIDTNLFLVVSDDEINPHIKAAFIKLGLDAQWLYIDDSNILQAWLNKPNSANAENLQELMEIPFMVIRLGIQGYANRALSGVLCELLMGRLLRYRPTWVISPRELESESCLEYSEELEYLLKKNFETNKRKKQKHTQNTTNDTFTFDDTKFNGKQTQNANLNAVIKKVRI
jgi:hypothetical protein